MNDSIQDKLAKTIHENFNACRGRNGVSPHSLARVIIDSDVIREVQADAWAEGVRSVWGDEIVGDTDWPENPYRN